MGLGASGCPRGVRGPGPLRARSVPAPCPLRARSVPAPCPPCPLTMRSPRRLFPASLLLLTVASIGSSAVTLRARDSLDILDSLDVGWGGEDGYYKSNDGVYCQKCPPGTYIAEECKEQKGSGRCEPCGYGEYMEYPNAFHWCRDCSKCREDQVEQSPCQPVRNTVCACRNGTFCPPEHPCEMCQKCQPRCPEGQVELKACRPDSDLQCGPAMESVPLYLIILFMLMAFVFISVAAVCSWKYCCTSPGNGRPSSRRPYEMVSSMFRKLPWYRRVNTGAEDNAANAHLQSQQCHTEPQVPAESGSPRKSLVPVPGPDPTQVLQSTFYTFAEKIPRNDWKRFGRTLHLEENDVVLATSEDGFYEMLYKWLSREGSRASLNTLLETLDRLHLSGVAEKISSVVVQDGRYQYESS